MSAEDLRLAVTPDFRYVIVSLADLSGPEAKAFVVHEGRAAEEPLIVEG